MNQLNYPSYENIAVCAYYLWENNDRPQGCHLDYWLQAEAHLKTTAEPILEAKTLNGAAPVEKPSRAKSKASARTSTSQQSTKQAAPKKPAKNQATAGKSATSISAKAKKSNAKTAKPAKTPKKAAKSTKRTAV